MKKTVKTILKIIKNIFGFKTHLGEIGNNGERVDINLAETNYYWQLDVYQKNHIKRYEYAAALINPNDECGDMACGSGYGSYILAKKAKKVIGVDISDVVINAIKERYKTIENLSFMKSDLRVIDFKSTFEKIVSFETVEHVEHEMVQVIFNNFSRALKQGGVLIFSVPYMQEKTIEAIEAGHHKTFHIDEKQINQWLMAAGLKSEKFLYQNYTDHEIREEYRFGDEFIICIASKRS